MSVQASVGSERNLLDETPEHARQLVIENPILRDDELERLRQVESDVFKAHTVDTTWPRRGRRRRPPSLRSTASAPTPTARSPAGANILILSDRAAGPDARADPVAARDRRRAPPSRARGNAAPGRHRRRVGRAAQRAQHRRARRLRRRRRQPVPHARDARRARRARLAARGDDRRAGAGARGEGDRQGPAQDDVEDGHLDDPVVLRRADLRGGRARPRARRALLHRHAVPHRRHRPARARRGRAHAPRARVSRRGRRAAAGDRAVRLAARRRAPPVEPGHDLAAPARGARPAARRRSSSTRATVERRRGAPLDAARAAAVPLPRRRRHPARGGRAGRGDRQAVLHRRDVARLDLARGARDARDAR